MRFRDCFPMLLCGGLTLVLTGVACGGSDKGGDAGNPTDAGIDAGVDAGLNLVVPSPAAIQAAQVLQQQIPGAAVHFSQHTGGIVRVDAPGISGLRAADGSPGVPLVGSHGADEAGEHASMMEFMLRFGGLYGLTDPGSELKVPRDPANDSISLSQDQFANGDLPHLASLRIRRLVQTFQGVPIPGRDVVGQFDGQGGLQSVTTRLLKVDPGFPVVPAFTGADLWNRFPSSVRDAAVQRNPRLAWLQAFPGPTVGLEHAEELVVEMVAPGGALDSAHPAAVPRLAYRQMLRAPGLEALLVVDASTGALIEALDTMPSDWASEGVASVAGTPDETGKNTVLFLTATFEPNRYMGIIKYAGIPDWIDPGNFVAISDTSGRANLALTYFAPMTIPTTISGVDNEWNTDPTYVGGKRQAGALVASITTTFDYWNQQRSWRGWDGQGSNFWASIYNHKNGTNPELNAWGASGNIQIGDGTTSTGQFCGSSREIMGHELTHNVISATTKLVYLNESGAVNESLADLFGVAMTANRAADDYSSDYIGDDVGWNLRNMRDPTLTGQPDQYKNYVVTAASSDSGGVHTNSGILNKAHTLLVKGGVFNGVTVPRVGLARVEQIVWASMRFGAYGASASMEEFAQGVISICKVTDGLNSLFGDTSYAATCSAFRKAYVAVGVLPSLFSDYAVVASVVNQDVLRAIVGNTSGKDLTSVVSHTSFVLTDGTSGKQFTLPARAATLETDGGAAADLLAGEQLVLTADLPDELKLAGASKRPVDLKLVVDGDVETTPSGEQLRHAGLTLGADFTPDGFTVTPGGSGFAIQATVDNLQGSGFPAGLQGSVLARHGGHANFDLFDGLTGQFALPAAQPGAGPQALLDLLTGSGAYNFGNGLPLIELPAATPIPGRPGRYEVWFDAQGGLDALDQRLQVYFLVDALNQVDELDETNNLLCVNCRAPAQPEGASGVIVRLPKGTPIASLFPSGVQAAAAKLPAAYDRVLPVTELARVRLPYRLTPNR